MKCHLTAPKKILAVSDKRKVYPPNGHFYNGQIIAPKCPTFLCCGSLFPKAKSTIKEHIFYVYKEEELIKEASGRKIGISDFSTKPNNYNNLDIIMRPNQI